MLLLDFSNGLTQPLHPIGANYVLISRIKQKRRLNVLFLSTNILHFLKFYDTIPTVITR